MKLTRPTLTGQDVLLDMLAPGEFFGSLSALGDAEYADTAQAQTACCILGIGTLDFQAILRQYPTIAIEVLNIVTGRLQTAQETIRQLSANSVESRVAAALLKLAEKLGEETKAGTLIQTPLSRQDLAEMTGTTTETVSRVLSHFRKAGLIRNGLRWVALTNRARLLALDGVPLGVLGVADSLRETAASMIQRLQEIGIQKIVMLTGDDRRTAQAIAKEVGVTEIAAELLPEDKLDVIRQLQKEGHVVAMVGDGINDAPALAAAEIGMAMGAAGTDVAIETADIALMADDLLKIPEAIRLSKATLRNIRQNVALALVTALLAGVFIGEVNMAAGMFIHELSVLVVIANGMRLLRA